MSNKRSVKTATVRRALGSLFVASYGVFCRARAKSFSILAAGAFASFGEKSVLEPPIILGRQWRIAIGSSVHIGPGSWLQVLDDGAETVAIEIGDGTSIVGGCVLSAAQSLVIGRHVLIARNVYISDHMHAFEDTNMPIMEQGISRIARVEVGDGAWLGENVVVGPGVRIGRGAVVGANAVVLSDVPDHAVAVGAPARVVRHLQAPSKTGVF